VYGNVLLNLGTSQGPAIHWNEDHGLGHGRADLGGKLYFYNNTLAVRRNQSEIYKFPVFSVNSGGGSCGAGTRGIIDVRNNVFANLAGGTGKPPDMFFAGCGFENFVFGKNWVSPGWILAFDKPYIGKASGVEEFVSPANNNPGFVNLTEKDVHLRPDSSAIRIAGPLAPETLHNSLGLDLTPSQEYSFGRYDSPRAGTGSGSDAGAFSQPSAARPKDEAPSKPIAK
jgi:hypothetical protein